MNKSSTLII